MDLRLRAIGEELRSSLFFTPMLFVVVAVALGQAMIALDSALGDRAVQLPFVLTSTVDSAREVLSVVASATITVAGIAFSVALLVIQQASSQYSPRVVHTLFRDPFNRRVMGLAVAVFTYCLIVLRSVRGPLEEGGDAVVPNLSVAVAVVLGVAAILAILAFINHNAHTMEVSEILGRITEDTKHHLDATWPEPGETDSPGDDVPTGPGHTVRFRESGWVQQVSDEQLLEVLPEGGTMRLETAVGRYAVQGSPVCTVWPVPDEPEPIGAEVAQAIHVGRVRTMQQDPSYGIRQMVDVALLALSPGVNDPTTAQEAVFHLADVTRHAFTRDAPAAVVSDDQRRRLVHAERLGHEQVVRLAFEEIRRAAASQPLVCLYLLEALRLLHDASQDTDRPAMAPLVREQAELVMSGAREASILASDLLELERAFAQRFLPRHPNG